MKIQETRELRSFEFSSSRAVSLQSGRFGEKTKLTSWLSSQAVRMPASKPIIRSRFGS